MTPKEKKSRKISLRIIALAVFIICAVVTYNRIQMERTNDQLREEKERLQAELIVQQTRKQELVEYKAYIQTNKYVEDMARSILGLVYPDEIILKPQE